MWPFDIRGSGEAGGGSSCRAYVKSEKTEVVGAGKL